MDHDRIPLGQVSPGLGLAVGWLLASYLAEQRSNCAQPWVLAVAQFRSLFALCAFLEADVRTKYILLRRLELGCGPLKADGCGLSHSARRQPSGASCTAGVRKGTRTAAVFAGASPKSSPSRILSRKSTPKRGPPRVKYYAERRGPELVLLLQDLTQRQRISIRKACSALTPIYSRHQKTR